MFKHFDLKDITKKNIQQNRENIKHLIKKDVRNNNNNVSVLSEFYKKNMKKMNTFNNNAEMIEFIKRKEMIVEMDAKLTKIHENKITTINQVYQESYTGNKHVTGFGDFIRGCYFLLEFCNEYNFTPKITINHPIASLMKNVSETKERVNPDIPFFLENNMGQVNFDKDNYIIGYGKEANTRRKFIDYLFDLPTKEKNILNTYNISFPYKDAVISEKNKQYIRELIEPSEKLNLYVNKTLKELSLEKKQYSVIHVRCGDKYLIEKSTELKNDFLYKIKSEIESLIHVLKNDKPTEQFLLITDNNEIKKKLVNFFPEIKVFYKEITHLGEGVLLKKDKVENTLLDFFLLSHSNSIHAYTIYQHGTGFSSWCAKTYDIPYKCMHISLY